MKPLFRKLPLAIKLIAIGLVPLSFLVYLIVQLHNEQSNKLTALDKNINRIYQSATLYELIGVLQNERKVSFDHSLGKSTSVDLKSIRLKADSLLQKVELSGLEGVKGFREYTFIDRLLATRKQIDSGRSHPNLIMHNYSNTIFRLNTLNTIPNSVNLGTIYEDMVAQKLLSELTTYLGI